MTIGEKQVDPQASEAADEMLPLVSVVLPVRNEARSIGRCLAALQNQTYPAEKMEIIVADGCSKDDTADIVVATAKRDPRIRLVKNERKNTPAGMNAAIRAASGDVILRMDGHSEASSDYVERGVRVLMETEAWCVGGRIRRAGITTAEKANAVAASTPLGVGDARHNYALVPGLAETVFPGIWPRWVFSRIGLFDEELVRNQDDELAFRIREAGGVIWYDPSLVVHYRPRGSLGSLFSQYRQYGYWKVRVFQKHLRAARWRHLIPAVWVTSLVGGSVLTLVWRGAIVLAGLAAGSHALLIGGSLTRRSVEGASRPRVYAAIVTMHLAYGVGFWQGLIRFAPRWFHNRHGTVPRLESNLEAETGGWQSGEECPAFAPGSPHDDLRKRLRQLLGLL